MKFLLQDTSQYFRWVLEMPTTLSKCKLLPTTFRMADAEFKAYFDEGNPAAMEIFLAELIIAQALLERH